MVWWQAVDQSIPPGGSSPAVPPDRPEPANDRKERFRLAAERARLHAKFSLLHVRYVLGYLAAGFGVSVPVTLGYQIYYGQDAGEVLALTGLSLLYALVCLVPFVLLEPMTRVAWEKMRVPEFRIFELGVSRAAAIVSLGFFALSLIRAGNFGAHMARWLPPGLFWTVFVLMGTAWAKIKAQTYIFPEFYADRGGERVLSIPTRDPAALCPPAGTPSVKGTGAKPDGTPV